MHMACLEIPSSQLVQVLFSTAFHTSDAVMRCQTGMGQGYNDNFIQPKAQ